MGHLIQGNSLVLDDLLSRSRSKYLAGLEPIQIPPFTDATTFQLAVRMAASAEIYPLMQHWCCAREGMLRKRSRKNE